MEKTNIELILVFFANEVMGFAHGKYDITIGDLIDDAAEKILKEITK
jgi:hypothetical protein